MTKGPTDQRDRFSRLYGETGGLYYEHAPRPELVALVDCLPAPSGEPHRALDLGCGEGRLSLYLARLGLQVTAVDIARPGVEKLLGVARHRGLAVEAEVGDAGTMVFPEAAFDLVVAETLLDHLDGPARDHAARGCLRALRPGGLLYAAVFTTQDPGYLMRTGALSPETGGELPPGVSETHGAVAHYFAPGELRELFHGLEVLSCDERTETDLSHGRPHVHGIACITARKPPAAPSR
jgi:SAM-dependent methyltransferase